MSAVKNVIKDNYNMMLLKDFLREKIKEAGFSHAEISKTPTGTRVALQPKCGSTLNVRCHSVTHHIR